MCRLCSLWAAGSSVRRWRCCWCRSAAGVVIWCGAGGADPSRCRWWAQYPCTVFSAPRVLSSFSPGRPPTTPSAFRAADPAGRAGGKMGKRKRPGQTARRALLLWPLVCTGGNGSGGVRPGAGGGADLLAVPVGMVSAGTVPAGGVPASRLALAVLHPGQFCRLPEGSDSPPNGSEKQV